MMTVGEGGPQCGDHGRELEARCPRCRELEFEIKSAALRAEVEHWKRARESALAGGDILKAEVEQLKDQGKTACDLFDDLKASQSEVRALNLQVRDLRKATEIGAKNMRLWIQEDCGCAVEEHVCGMRSIQLELEIVEKVLAEKPYGECCEGFAKHCDAHSVSCRFAEKSVSDTCARWTGSDRSDFRCELEKNHDGACAKKRKDEPPKPWTKEHCQREGRCRYPFEATCGCQCAQCV